MALHDGHRERVRQRFLKEGLDGFNDHQVLEMLLFYCVSRKDTNLLAHQLLDEFGSLAQVLEASPEALKKVPGVGESVATFISFSSSLARYYMVNRSQQEPIILDSLEKCGARLQPHFVGRRNECVYMLCLDGKCKFLACKMIGEGSINSAAVPIRRIVEVALHTNASTVVLAHNHPSGLALPSKEDAQTTGLVANALRAVDVVLWDHMIFSENEYVSMVHSNIYNRYDHLLNKG
ncbi:MAG: DNA repair protein RadC [Oscillospiraceae bacterium]|nr:DNA repair protein RadC [Oscillospiraceae bacterium]